MKLREKILIYTAIILLGLGVMLIASIGRFGKLRVIACEVGQGDATLIVTNRGSQILVDGGPGKRVLDCLGSYMPFWDRSVELMVLTHPQKDHMEGLIAVLENYKVRAIVWTGVYAESGLFGEWVKALGRENAAIIKPHTGQKLTIDNVDFEVLWPTKQKIAEWKEDAPDDLNESSIVLRLNYDGFCMLLTGDMTRAALQGLALRSCQVLKISHHGSKTGTNGEILEKVKPKVAIIEVGKNSYGHPHQEVLDLLISYGIEVYRTDTDGTVEFNYNNGKLRIVRDR